jgi:hypothetical protein
MNTLANFGNLFGVDGIVLGLCMLMALAITGAIVFAAIMMARKNQGGGAGAPIAGATGQQAITRCENCGRQIGALERCQVWKEKHTVCAECFVRLQGQG